MLVYSKAHKQSQPNKFSLESQKEVTKGQSGGGCASALLAKTKTRPGEYTGERERRKERAG